MAGLGVLVGNGLERMVLSDGIPKVYDWAHTIAGKLYYNGVLSGGLRVMLVHSGGYGYVTSTMSSSNGEWSLTHLPESIVNDTFTVLGYNDAVEGSAMMAVDNVTVV